MRIALYDGPDALTTIVMPPQAAQSPRPWEVAVMTRPTTTKFDPNHQHSNDTVMKLRFTAVRISVVNNDRSIGYTYIATCADPETSEICRQVFANAADIPGILPQHVPNFIERLRDLLKAAG